MAGSSARSSARAASHRSRLVLCHLQEIVLLLEQGRDLKEWLRAKVRAAETEQKPFVRGA